MYRPSRPQMPQLHMGWGHHRPPFNPQWRHPGGPRAPFHGQRQRFHQPRQPFQPVNDNFWCETCDRGFPTEDSLNKHKQQHQKCNIDGCQFIAHPKVITKHIQMQHSTGLYKKIANLKNPEEIAKWREERRKRYPTQSNIDKKAAELKEKIERGEKIGLDRGRRQRDKPNLEQNKLGPGVKRRSETRNENQPRHKVRRNNNSNNNHNKAPKSKPDLQSNVAENNKLKPFAGILNLQMDSDEEIEHDTTLNDLIEDDDGEVKLPEIENTADDKSEPVVCGALSTLMCEYGSSDEEDISEKAQTNTKSVKKPQSIEIKNTEKLNIDSRACHKNNSIDSANCKSKPKVTSDLKNMCQLTDGNESTEINQDIPEDKDHTDGSNVVIQTLKPVEIFNTSQENNQAKQSIAEDDKLRSSQVCETNIKGPILDTPIEEDSDSGPDEIKTETKKEENTPPVAESSRTKDTRKRTQNTRRGNQAYQHRKTKLPSSLLQKLLAKEMQQERNIVLQCIRYIRRNNYFDKKE